MFSRGWGDEELLSALTQQLSFADPLPDISVQWRTTCKRRGKLVQDGTFPSPLLGLPTAADTVHVRACTRPMNRAACVVLAGSRDEGYAIREWVFGKLVSRGLDLYLLENPFYGRRRVGTGSILRSFSDFASMTLAMVWEARALLEYLRDRYEKLGIAGYSMGGHMAAITACACRSSLACAAMATGASAVPIYTQGLLSWSVDLYALAGPCRSLDAAQERLGYLISFADLTRQPPPVRTDAALIVGCVRDGYVLRSETERLHSHWPGSSLRWVPAGHVSALITSRSVLRDAVFESITRL